MKDLHRCNLEESSDGTLRLCRGEHEKCASCEWEEYVPIRKLEDLKRLLGEAREMIFRLKLSGDFHNLPESLLTDAETTIARIDATLDPDCLEGPPRTREERIADAHALDEVAPTMADKVALMFRGTPKTEKIKYHDP